MSSVTVTSPSEPESARKAPPPFDKSSADIVLRSADLVDFLVHSHILIVASSVFEAILSLPHTPSQDARTVDGRPVIVLTEDSNTIETLLLMCYPVEKEEVSRTVSEMELYLKAALKYEMSLPVAILTKDLRAAASEAPLSVWAAACRIGVESMAHHAASLALRLKLDLTSQQLDLLEGVSAADYFRLRQFHRLRGKVDDTFRLLTPPLVDDPRPLKEAVLSTLPPREILPDMPYPDLICRSSDDVDFQVHRAFLSVASPALYSRIRNVLSVRDESGDSTTSFPVLELEESSRVLAALLRMCYPTITDLPSHPDDYAALLSAAEKYQMARVQDDIRKQWRLVAQPAPLEAYLTASRMGWMEGAKVAARFTLERKSLAEIYHPSMERTRARAYHSLLLFHESSGTMLRNKLQEQAGWSHNVGPWQSSPAPECTPSFASRWELEDLQGDFHPWEQAEVPAQMVSAHGAMSLWMLDGNSDPLSRSLIFVLRSLLRGTATTAYSHLRRPMQR